MITVPYTDPAEAAELTLLPLVQRHRDVAEHGVDDDFGALLREADGVAYWNRRRTCEGTRADTSRAVPQCTARSNRSQVGNGLRTVTCTAPTSNRPLHQLLPLHSPLGFSKRRARPAHVFSRRRPRSIRANPDTHFARVEPHPGLAAFPHPALRVTPPRRLACEVEIASAVVGLQIREARMAIAAWFAEVVAEAPQAR